MGVEEVEEVTDVEDVSGGTEVGRDGGEPARGVEEDGGGPSAPRVIRVARSADMSEEEMSEQASSPLKALKVEGLSAEVAQRAFEASAVVDERGERYVMTSLSLAGFGSGVSIYFSMLLYMAIAFLVAGLVGGGMWGLAFEQALDPSSKEDSTSEEWDAVISGLWRWEDPSVGTGRTVDAGYIWINTVILAWIFASAVALKILALGERDTIDDGHVTDSDYTMEIMGLPITPDGQPGFKMEDLARYLADVPLRTNGQRGCTAGKVDSARDEVVTEPLQISLINDATGAIQCANELHAALLGLQSVVNQLGDGRRAQETNRKLLSEEQGDAGALTGTVPPVRQKARDLERLERLVTENEQQVAASLEKLREECNKPQRFTGGAYVTFDLANERNTVVRLLTVNSLTDWFHHACTASDPDDPEMYSFMGNKLTVTAAPEPRDLIWPNFGFSEPVRRSRIVMTWLFVAIPLIVMSFYFQLWLNTLEDSNFFISISVLRVIGILAANGILFVVMPLLSEVERPATFSGEGTSRALKMVVAQLANMTLPPMFLYYSGGLAVQKLADFGFTLIIGEGLRGVLLDTAATFSEFYGRRWFGDKHAGTQQELNEFYEGTFFDLSIQCSQVPKVTLLALFYAPVCPAVLLVASASLMANYALDKYCLLYLSAPPPTFNEQMPVFCIHMQAVGVAACAIFSAIVFYNLRGTGAEASTFAPSMTLLALGCLCVVMCLWLIPLGSADDSSEEFRYSVLAEKSGVDLSSSKGSLRSSSKGHVHGVGDLPRESAGMAGRIGVSAQVLAKALEGMSPAPSAPVGESWMAKGLLMRRREKKKVALKHSRPKLSFKSMARSILNARSLIRGVNRKAADGGEDVANAEGNSKQVIDIRGYNWIDHVDLDRAFFEGTRAMEESRRAHIDTGRNLV